MKTNCKWDGRDPDCDQCVGMPSKHCCRGSQVHLPTLGSSLSTQKEIF